jgi:hypothetical protein
LPNSQRQFVADVEPTHKEPFEPKWEKVRACVRAWRAHTHQLQELQRTSMFDLRDKMYKFVTERTPLYSIPLCINPHSAAYKNFARWVGRFRKVRFIF